MEWIKDQLAFCTPFLVGQDKPKRLAIKAPVKVAPLLPPQPTSSTPNLGTVRSVRNVSFSVTFLAFKDNNNY